MLNTVINANVTSRDIDIADIIYGPKSFETMMGNIKRKKVNSHKIELFSRSIQQLQAGFIDLMFI